jgi:transposase
VAIKRLIERCAGLDVHKKSVTACVRVPGPGAGERTSETRTFSTTTAGLLVLRDWLTSFGVTVVGMESTGVLWKPVFYLLEDDFDCWLLNAQHLRNVPGRKTDVKDAAWIAELVEYGLVRPSFVPPKPIRQLRDLTRYRKAVIEEHTREAQRLHAVLQEAGIKLSSVATDILGRSGRDMLEALVGGTHDPQVLAELARGRMRPKIAALREALEGRFSAHHALLVAEMLARLDHADETIARLSAEIERAMAPFAEQVELLRTIPGVDRRVAEVIVAETGGDMARFPSPGAPGLLGWGRPGQQRVGRQAPPQPNPQGRQVAAQDPHRGGLGGGTDQRHLPGRPVRPAQGPPWPHQGQRGGRALHPGHRLLRPGARGALLRPRRRLLPAPPVQRRLQGPPGPPAGTDGPKGHPGTRRTRRITKLPPTDPEPAARLVRAMPLPVITSP